MEIINIRRSVRKFKEDKISEEIIDLIILLTKKYIYDRNEPDRSIDVLDEVCSRVSMKENENITLLLNSSVLDAECEENKVKSVTAWQLTTYSYHKVTAKYFADCSGDSILAPLTGAEHRIGREAKSEYNEKIGPETADRKTMGMSCLLQARETDHPVKYIPPKWANIYETDEDFMECYHFCEELNFSTIHVFPFSVRTGTAAASMAQQVDEKTKKERTHKLLDLSLKLTDKYYNKFLNKKVDVLVEETGKESAWGLGHTDSYLLVELSEKVETNKFYSVKILEIKDNVAIGKIEK